MDKWMWRCCAPGSQISSLRDARASPAAIPPVSASYHLKQNAASICNTMPKHISTHTLTHINLHLMLWATFHWVENLPVCWMDVHCTRCTLSILMWLFGCCLASEVIETRSYDSPLNVHTLRLHVGNLMGWLDWMNHFQSSSSGLWMFVECVTIVSASFDVMLCSADQCGTLGIFLTRLFSKLFSLQQRVK